MTLDVAHCQSRMPSFASAQWNASSLWDSPASERRRDSSWARSSSFRKFAREMLEGRMK